MRDELIGIGLIVGIAALAGAVAYVGDRVGHQVGRKRLTLFGIRPRYTSTIVAIGTGVVIALIVTLGAIFASQEVKTAFFRMGSINDQIAALTRTQQDLEKKVNDTQIVLPLNAPVSVNVARLPKGSTADARLKIVRDYYAATVTIVDSSYPQLKPFQPPADINELLNKLAAHVDTTNDDALVIATADRNLFVGDRVHFQLSSVVDSLQVHSGEVIAPMSIQAGANANVGLAFAQLQQHVAEQLSKKMPSLFVGTPQAVRTYPSVDEMQRMLTSGHKTFVMTAFAAEDIYPHTSLQTGGLPIVVVLSQQP